MWNLQNAFSLRTIKVCQFKIRDGVKYIYCIKHAHNFLLKGQVGFAAVHWPLSQCVSCFSAERDMARGTYIHMYL